MIRTTEVDDIGEVCCRGANKRDRESTRNLSRDQRTLKANPAMTDLTVGYGYEETLMTPPHTHHHHIQTQLGEGGFSQLSGTVMST